jgi:predicted TIM-barrel fold metal-dependent hydrolase
MGLIDTHLHLFDPQVHPFNVNTIYHPQPHECASLAVLRDVLAAHGVNKAILVAPTVGYNHDLLPLTESLASAKPLLVGVARLRGDEDLDTLKTLSGLGVQGVRIDLRHDGVSHASWLSDIQAPQRWQQLGWFVQVQADAAIWREAGRCVSQWPVPLVIDHCGLPDVSAGLDQSGFQFVCDLSQRPNTWIKLSGAFRFSKQAWPFEDTNAFAQRLLLLYGPERCLWGSDWPFVRMQTRLDYGAVLDHFKRWVPDVMERKVILQESPLSLLGRHMI